MWIENALRMFTFTTDDIKVKQTAASTCVVEIKCIKLLQYEHLIKQTRKTDVLRNEPTFLYEFSSLKIATGHFSSCINTDSTGFSLVF